MIYLYFYMVELILYLDTDLPIFVMKCPGCEFPVSVNIVDLKFMEVRVEGTLQQVSHYHPRFMHNGEFTRQALISCY